MCLFCVASTSFPALGLAMPICTTCTTAVPFLYTVYESAYNLRLEQCTRCRAFADPYVEHDTLALVLDLILLKRGVFRHLLYNRGTEPRREEEEEEEEEKARGRRAEASGGGAGRRREQLFGRGTGRGTRWRQRWGKTRKKRTCKHLFSGRRKGEEKMEIRGTPGAVFGRCRCLHSVVPP